MPAKKKQKNKTNSYITIKKINVMNKRIITGAVIALAAGIAAFIYRRNRSRINEAAADAYNTTKDAVEYAAGEVENTFS